MCGRYVAATPPDQLAKYFEAVEVRADDVPPSWNVAPTREVYAVAARKEDGARQLGSFRWGLVPSWADDPGIGPRMINARSESVADKPAFRNALQRRRCVIPADAFYEWQMKAAQKTKQPWLVRRADGEPLAFAGLWEAWRDAEGGWLRTCCIVTTSATGPLADLHDRCPVILERDEWPTWLDREITEAGEVLRLLQPNPPDLLEMFPVSRRVNDVRNDDESLVEPAQPEDGEPEAPTLFD